jgi:hypothetical protein
MKFVQNNKILVDSNAETAEISAEKAQLPLASLRFLCDLCVSALKKPSPKSGSHEVRETPFNAET